MSWRFVDWEFVFFVLMNLWFFLFFESIFINNLDDDVMFNDFVVIKVGDVNNSVMMILFIGIDEWSFCGVF